MNEKLDNRLIAEIRYAEEVERQRDAAIDSLRELHDFAVTDYRHADRVLRAFEKAAELLKRYGK